MILIECPLCSWSSKKRTASIAATKFAKHLKNKHDIRVESIPIGDKEIQVELNPCPCCKKHFYMEKNWIAHVRRRHNFIIAALHAFMLGVKPETHQ